MKDVCEGFSRFSIWWGEGAKNWRDAGICAVLYVKWYSFVSNRESGGEKVARPALSYEGGQGLEPSPRDCTLERHVMRRRSPSIHEGVWKTCPYSPRSGSNCNIRTGRQR